MQNFVAVRPDPLHLPLPNGLSEDQQSSKSILQFCWMVKMEGGNKVRRCKLCNKKCCCCYSLLVENEQPIVQEMLGTATTSTHRAVRNRLDEQEAGG